MKHVIYNGILAIESELRLEATNRGFLFGDGVFESIRVKDEKVYFFSDHFERLTKGLQVLGIINPMDEKSLKKWILDLVRNSELMDARIKVVVWRKPGGLFRPDSKEADFLITANSFLSMSEIKSKVGISKSIKNHPSPVSAFKTLSSIKYVLAGKEMTENNWNEIILLDYQGHISEGLSTNIFWLKGGTVFTPHVQTGCVEGVMRRNVLNYLQKHHIPVEEGFYLPSDLLDAEVLFTTNISGISCLKELNGKMYTTSPLLIDALKDYLIK